MAKQTATDLQLDVLRNAASKVDNLIAATRGDHSRCTVFDSRPGFGVEPFTDAQLRAIRGYVETWISVPLNAAIQHVEGDRSYAVTDLVEQYARRPW